MTRDHTVLSAVFTWTLLCMLTPIQVENIAHDPFKHITAPVVALFWANLRHFQ